MTIYTNTSVDEKGQATTVYYTESKITQSEYKNKFGQKIALKKNQKLITVRNSISHDKAKALIADGANLAYKN